MEDTEIWRISVTGQAGSQTYRYWGSAGRCVMWPLHVPSFSSRVWHPGKQQGCLFCRFVSKHIVQSPLSSNLFPVNLTMFSPSLLSMVGQWSFLSLLFCIHTEWKFLNSEPQTYRNGIKENYSDSNISEIPDFQNYLIKHYQEHQN